MDIADLLQTVSLAAVAITLILSARQMRLSARQTHEAVRQSALARSALTQAAQYSLVDNGTNNLVQLVAGERSLLAWFLASRGIPPATEEINKRYLLLFVRLEVHEFTYLAYLDGTLSVEFWNSWHEVILLDSATPEFRTLWSVVHRQYSYRFAEFVNETVAAYAAAPVPPSGESVAAPVNVDEQVPEHVVERPLRIGGRL